MSTLALLPSIVGGILWAIPAFLFVLTIVVFFHELGHFLVARWCGVKVDSFSICFGREIIGRTDKHGTRWRLGWIPMGGYVKMAGDLNPASVPSPEVIATMSEEERAGALQLKPLWQRAAVMAAGPFASFLLAIFIYAGLYSMIGKLTYIPRIDIVTPGGPAARAGILPGDIIRKVDGSTISGITDFRRLAQFSGDTPLELELERGGQIVSLVVTPEYKEVKTPIGGTAKIGAIGIDTIMVPARVGAVGKNSAAAKAGIKPLDLIVSINGTKIVRFDDLKKIVEASAGKSLTVIVKRQDSLLTMTVVPLATKIKTAKGETKLVGRFGISSYRDPASWTHKKYGPFTALWLGVKETGMLIKHSMSYLKDVFRGKQSADQLGGPILIAEVAAQAADRGILSLIEIVALISASIGFINLFPIPILDGGHLMIYAMEAIRGRPLGEKALDITYRIGLAMVLSLFIFVSWNDILRNVGKLSGAS